MQENKIKSLQEIRQSRCTKGYEQGDNAMPTDDHLVTEIDSIWENSWEAMEEWATDTRLVIRPALTSLLTMPNSKTTCNMSNNKIKHRIQPCTNNAEMQDQQTCHETQVQEIQHFIPNKYQRSKLRQRQSNNQINAGNASYSYQLTQGIQIQGCSICNISQHQKMKNFQMHLWPLPAWRNRLRIKLGLKHMLVSQNQAWLQFLQQQLKSHQLKFDPTLTEKQTNTGQIRRWFKVTFIA